MFSAQRYVSRSTPYRVLLRIGLAAVVVLGLGANAIAQSGDDGVCSVVAVPGAIYTTAEGVNSSGTVVGSYFTPEIGAFGYIYSNGQFTTLTAPDSLWTVAHGINDAGVVVGAFLPATPICHCVDDIEAHGFITQGGFTIFDVGRSKTMPLAINNTGTIVGYYNDRDGDIEDAPRGFLLSAGGLTRIDATGWRSVDRYPHVRPRHQRQRRGGRILERRCRRERLHVAERRDDDGSTPREPGAHVVERHRQRRNNRRHDDSERWRRRELQVRGQPFQQVRLLRAD